VLLKKELLKKELLKKELLKKECCSKKSVAQKSTAAIFELMYALQGDYHGFSSCHISIMLSMSTNGRQAFVGVMTAKEVRKIIQETTP